MTAAAKVRTVEDLDRAGRALATHFQTDVVVVVGSQAVLTGWPDAPVIMRTSSEIDAYPANARIWEKLPRNKDHGIEASEEINALFGEMSTFHEQFGFYIDGVDDTSARLHPDWRKRAVFRNIPSHSGMVVIISPSIEDMVVSKLSRLVEKDKGWLTSLNENAGIDRDLAVKMLSETSVAREKVHAAAVFLQTLPDMKKSIERRSNLILPAIPVESHCIFYEDGGSRIVVRKWDPDIKLFNKVDNPLGPAIVTQTSQVHMLDGKHDPKRPTIGVKIG